MILGMRLRFNQPKRDSLWAELKKNSGLSWSSIARSIEVHPRTFSGWRAGASSIPDIFLQKIKEKYNVTMPEPDSIESESSVRSRCGRMGGLRRIALYGNLGTAEGRKLGGINSIKSQSSKPFSHFTQKPVSMPPYSSELAEFVGIVLGDGGITKRQITISLHKHDDRLYAEYVRNLAKKLFQTDASVIDRPQKEVVNVLISRTAAVNFLISAKIGLSIGNKVRRQADIPEWIKNSNDMLWKKSCIRGLFDTDGCFFIDRHHIKNKLYYSCGINFTNRSLPLIAFFKQTLEELGYHPTISSAWSLFLRREDEVIRYLSKDIGTSNLKYMERLEMYQRIKHGRVPKRS